MLHPEELHFDVLPVILSHLSDRRDLYAATLVSKAFNKAGAPILYENLDSRLIETNKACLKIVAKHWRERTLLKKPTFAYYVRNIVETGTVHGAPQGTSQSILELAVEALRLCKRISSFSWLDDHFLPDNILVSFLDVLLTLPLQELTIRTFGNLSEPTWQKIYQLKGLKSVSIYCMEGPPRVLQGWSQSLSMSLTRLELGRCSGVPSTILINIFSHLKKLDHLRIKGVPSNAIPFILSYTPHLISLDTDYSDSSGAVRLPASLAPMPRLQSLTVRTSSVDNGGPRGLWQWICQIIPVRSLQSLCLHSFSTLGETSIPRGFLLFLAQVHGEVLTTFLVETTTLLLDDVACLCDKFPKLEELSCSVADADVGAISFVILRAHNLRSLRLNLQWFQTSFNASAGSVPPFTVDNARDMMLREKSRLRSITIGPFMYKGQWVLEESDESSPRIKFDVQRIHLRSANGET